MYNPSSGILSTTAYSGTINTAAQPNITSVGTLGSLSVAGVSTFSGDVKFTGDSANILFDKSDDALELDDGAQIRINGTALRLLNSGTTGLIKGNDLQFMSMTGNDNYITCTF